MTWVPLVVVCKYTFLASFQFSLQAGLIRFSPAEFKGIKIQTLSAWNSVTGRLKNQVEPVHLELTFRLPALVAS